MKVLYVSKASWVAAHRDKVAALARRVDVTLVLPQRWGTMPEEPRQPHDPRTVSLPAVLHGHNHFHLYRGLGELMDVERPDIVHADEEAYSAVTAQVASLCSSRRLPFVFFAAQTLNKRLPPPFGALRRRVFARAAGGIGGTEQAALVLRQSGYRGPLAVIAQMGVDPARFRPDPAARAEVRAELGIRADRVVVGYLGRLIPEKGVDLLLDAVARVPDVDALVIGAGPEEGALRARADAGGIALRTRFVGAVPSFAVPRWLAALDVLVLPSLTTPSWAEQFGRVLVEAMACGVAVLGSDSGEIPVVLGDAGVVVPEGSADALRTALERLAADPDERRRLGVAGRQRVLSLYTQDAIVDATVQFYGEIT